MQRVWQEIKKESVDVRQKNMIKYILFWMCPSQNAMS